MPAGVARPGRTFEALIADNLDFGRPITWKYLRPQDPPRHHRGVRGQVLMSFLVRAHMSVAGQAGSLQGTTSASEGLSRSLSR